MRLIDADELEATMYHEAFETDSDMQKWDSGCWIRYKMFENVLNSIPTIDTCPVYKEKFKNLCDECQEFDCYGSENKMNNKMNNNPCETCTELYCVRDCEYYKETHGERDTNEEETWY